MTSDWHKAAIDGDERWIADRLEWGQSVDARDRYSQTALMLAALHGHPGIVERLVAAGAALDVTAKYGLSALMLAVVNHRDSIARHLATAGADLSLRGTGAPGFADKTASDLARDSGQTELAEWLAGEIPGRESDPGGGRPGA